MSYTCEICGDKFDHFIGWDYDSPKICEDCEDAMVKEFNSKILDNVNETDFVNKAANH